MCQTGEAFVVEAEHVLQDIAGVGTAIAIGGPGALFWMWMTALVGMATKYAEAVLAVRYREVDDNNNHVGGPMYYIRNGLGKNWLWMATLFAVFGGLAPASRPRLAVVVVVHEPGEGVYYGGEVAAPVFAEVASGALRVLGVAPDETPADTADQRVIQAMSQP